MEGEAQKRSLSGAPYRLAIPESAVLSIALCHRVFKEPQTQPNLDRFQMFKEQFAMERCKVAMSHRVVENSA